MFKKMNNKINKMTNKNNLNSNISTHINYGAEVAKITAKKSVNHKYTQNYKIY